MNQFVTTAVAEKLAAFATLEYLEARGRRSSEARFAAALARVPDVDADTDDRQSLHRGFRRVEPATASP